jgi:hypothetical protein
MADRGAWTAAPAAGRSPRIQRCPASSGWAHDLIDKVRLRDDFDKMAVVVDWLDCCRNRNLDALLDLYAGNANLECACENARHTGRSQLAAYWRPKLSTLTPDAFGLEEITPGDDDVTLVYLSFEGKPVRMTFAFDADGKIAHTKCRPAAGLARQLSA